MRVASGLHPKPFEIPTPVKMVVIDHGYGYTSRYGHLSEYAVKSGQKVARGDVIGYMGSTGYSTGPHLHYEVWRNGKPLNPREYILNTK